MNLDLIFGVPTQTPAMWRRSLETTMALGPEHISAYNLTYEEDTEFFRRFVTGELTQDAGADADLFELTADTLAAGGFEPYEISNFARPGRECAHNLAYWLGAITSGWGRARFRRWASGVGPTCATRRRTTTASTPGRRRRISRKTCRWRCGARRVIAFGLRTNRGVPAETLRAWPEQVAEFAALGLLETTPGDRVLLTRKGRLLADAVAEAFV